MMNSEFAQHTYASLIGDWFGVAESTRTAVLSPGRDRSPFATVFPRTDVTGSTPLIKQQVRSVESTESQSAISVELHPNPVMYHGSFTLKLSRAMQCSLELFDARGRSMLRVFHGELARGVHVLPFSAEQLDSGTYVYRLQTDREQLTGIAVVRR
jgi:hypothetical protein